ncbi:MAG: hypothetical protein ACOCU6_01810 [Nanoarchaeota archaeon]
MEERTLIRISLVTAIIGFSVLALITTLQEPVSIEMRSELPEDTTVEFKGSITRIRQTSSGSSITIRREVEETGFIDNNVSKDLEGMQATITAIRSDDFIEIKKIQLRNSVNGS